MYLKDYFFKERESAERKLFKFFILLQKGFEMSKIVIEKIFNATRLDETSSIIQ